MRSDRPRVSRPAQVSRKWAPRSARPPRVGSRARPFSSGAASEGVSAAAGASLLSASGAAGGSFAPPQAISAERATNEVANEIRRSRAMRRGYSLGPAIQTLRQAPATPKIPLGPARASSDLRADPRSCAPWPWRPRAWSRSRGGSPRKRRTRAGGTASHPRRRCRARGESRARTD